MSELRLHRLCAKADVPEGRIRPARVPGYEPLAVVHSNGSFYVIADTCSHGLASLSEGEIIEGQVYCPFHGGAFNIKTGEATERPCTIAIATYPVIEQGDDLFIAVKAQA
jgi:nitrite reductase/ring-hydroxylating ferredoxin subunit